MGEGPSFSAARRLDATARLVELGLPADRLVLGIGGGALSEQAWLGRQAGPSASPPCWRRRPSSSATSIRKASTRATPRWPRHSGPKRRRCCSITFRRSAACRWRSRRSSGSSSLSGRIRGIKDSGADLAYTRALLAAVGERTTVLVGAERHLPDAMPAGARGTICGLANLVPGGRVQAGRRRDGRARRHRGLCRGTQRRAGDPDGEGSGGHRAGRPAWAACMPPLRAVTARRRVRWRSRRLLADARCD